MPSTRGQLLFTIEATDMVQAQNDFIAGIAARNKAHSQLGFAEIDERRYRTLSKDKAVAAAGLRAGADRAGGGAERCPCGRDRA